jgi:hypothetical protein
LMLPPPPRHPSGISGSGESCLTWKPVQRREAQRCTCVAPPCCSLSQCGGGRPCCTGGGAVGPSSQGSTGRRPGDQRPWQRCGPWWRRGRDGGHCVQPSAGAWGRWPPSKGRWTPSKGRWPWRGEPHGHGATGARLGHNAWGTHALMPPATAPNAPSLRTCTQLSEGIVWFPNDEACTSPLELLGSCVLPLPPKPWARYNRSLSLKWACIRLSCAHAYGSGKRCPTHPHGLGTCTEELCAQFDVSLCRATQHARNSTGAFDRRCVRELLKAHSSQEGQGNEAKGR